MNTISGIYKITNTITGDFYIGSSNDIKIRWANHKCKSRWKQNPNSQLYKDMQKYGLENFEFEILEEAEEIFLKEKEQEFIEKLQPTYNSNNAKGIDIEKVKECQKKYQKSDKCKETQKKYQKSDKYKESKKKYRKSDKGKETQKKYQKSDKGKEYQKQYHKEYDKEYYSQLCSYNGQTLTLAALRMRFRRKGIPHPVLEAKKYLI